MIHAAATCSLGALYAAVAAGRNVIGFCSASEPIKGLKEVDVAHNIGAAANEVVKTLATLRDNATCKDLDELFTRSENTPTPAVSTAQPTTLGPSPTEGP